ncbi:hypothetical protein FGADI_4379 [Fusarium gaditjirri]|uniref:Uncharacterized protein n=1 Tax=Fusarium gaditjirri TaxID=282569 RepID=A0A8H4TD41_9HYPO|nr:hypothetical protein FGADI_4379 [Fusarium gaditjirri]
MAQNSPRPKEPQVKQNGFTLTKGFFRATNGDVALVSASRLRELFQPESLRLKRDQKEASETARQLFRKSFFAGQLRHYGIKLPKSGTTDTLRYLLRDAVLDGKCDKVPESIIALRESMERDLLPLYKKWEKDVREWDINDRQRRLVEFDSCETPGQKASYDLHLFLSHYFTTDGQPDQRKTPEPLSLEGFCQRYQLEEMVRRIPGLCTAAGGSGNHKTICIGWNKSAVALLAADITSRALDAEKHEAEMRWEKAMDQHRQFVSTLKTPAPSQDRKGKKVFDLELCQGSYVIKCDPVTSGWQYLNSHILTMNIFAGKKSTLRATYDFGIIEGTMHLSNEDDFLVDLTDDRDDDDSQTDDIAESEDESEEKEITNGRKRSLAQDLKNKRKSRPHKKRRLAPSLSRRVFYRLRGQETGEGQVLPDPEPGQIDFLDDNCTKFSGLAYRFPYVGSNVEFSGYKISNTPKGFEKSWDDYSEGAYDRARMGRWR